MEIHIQAHYEAKRYMRDNREKLQAMGMNMPTSANDEARMMMANNQGGTKLLEHKTPL